MQRNRRGAVPGRMTGMVLACCILFWAAWAPRVMAADIVNFEVVPSLEGKGTSRVEFRFDVRADVEPDAPTATGEAGKAHVTRDVLVVLSMRVRGRMVSAENLHMRGDVGVVPSGTGKVVTWDMAGDFPEGYAGPVKGEIAAYDVWTEPLTGMRFVRVDGRCFEMGCGKWNPVCDEDELPTRRACPADFWMGRDEVTNAQFCAYLNGRGSALPGVSVEDFPGIARREGEFVPQKGEADEAVAGINWFVATDFARWLSRESGKNFSLPSEAQWEFACRSAGRWYAFGTLDGMPETDDMDAPVAAPSGANLLGLEAMSGGVWEWTGDTYRPGSDTYRVLRGGRDGSQTRNARCANRYPRNPSSTDAATGFRLVRTDMPN